MLKKILSSQLRTNMVSGPAATLVNAAVLAVAYPVYLHFLGYELYGLWLILATVLTFALLGNLGIDRAVVKLVAEEYGRGDIAAIEKCLTAAISILVAMGVVALLLILAFRASIVGLFRLGGENKEIVLALLPYIGCLSVYVFVVQVVSAALSGLGRMDLANYVQTGGRIVKVAVASLLLFWGRGIESLLIANTLSYVVVHLVSMLMIRRIVHIRLLRLGNVTRGDYKRLLGFGGPVFGGSLLGMLFSPFNKLILSRYVGVQAVPVYDIAYTSSMTVRTLIESGLRALMPEISRIDARKTLDARNRIASICRRSMRIIFLLGMPLYIILACLAPMLLRLWLGDKYVETLPGAFRIMLLGTYFSLLGVPAYYTLMGTGRVRHTFMAHMILSVVNVLLVLCVAAVSTVTVTVTVSICSSAMAAATLYLTLQNWRVNRGIRCGGANAEPTAQVSRAVAVWFHTCVLGTRGRP